LLNLLKLRQNESINTWPGDSIAAISFAFDGTLAEHVSAARLLSEFNVCATFFAYAPNLLEDISGWREIAEAGHELGNHALYGLADRDGLLPELDPDAFFAELADLDALLSELGVNCATIACPMVSERTEDPGKPSITAVLEQAIGRMNDEQFEPFLPNYSAVRGPRIGVNTLPINPFDLRSFPADILDGDSLCVMAQIGISQRAWTILTFGGVGSPIFDEAALRRLLEWLQSKPVWVAPIQSVVRHVAAKSVPLGI
jgi:peptidoglycan/xylan/chitin deacetylase (PgdA/CDA1 family)